MHDVSLDDDRGRSTSANASRRRFLKWGVRAGICGSVGVGVYTWRIEPHWIKVIYRELPIAGLPDTLSGRTLVQISDLHIGPVVDDDYMIAALEQVNGLHPDILVITGDFMTCDGIEEVDHAVRVMETLKPARLATVGVLGNHDYGHRWSFEPAAKELTRKLSDSGIQVLRNEIRSVQGLQVIGVDDFWGPHFRPSPTLAKRNKDATSIVLCHNPDAADQPGWNGYTGWILCGHTHGGQCKSPFFRPPLLPVRNKRYVRGEIDLADGRRLYINPGLGYLRRVRFNVRPEITVFRLGVG